MLSAIIAPEILPAWALKQRNAAMAVKDLYNNPEGLSFKVKRLLKYCSEYIAEEQRAITEGRLRQRKGMWLIGSFKKLLRDKVRFSVFRYGNY